MKLIDLTQTISEKTPVYPGDPKVKIKQVKTLDKDDEVVHKIELSSQTATHVESSAHTLKNGKFLNEIPLESFIGYAAIVDVPLRELKLNDLKKKEKLIENSDFLILRSGYMDKINKINTKDRNRPKLPLEVIKWVASKKIKLFGIDSFGFDYAPDWKGHEYLFKHDILVLEGLVNLHKIKNERVKLFVIPLKFKNTEASPCRVFALK